MLAWKCVDMDKDCHKYFSGTGNIFVINCYKYQILFIIYIYFVTQLKKKRKIGLTDIQNGNMKKQLYCNNVDTFWIFLKITGMNWWNVKNEPCRARKEAL